MCSPLLLTTIAAGCKATGIALSETSKQHQLKPTKNSDSQTATSTTYNHCPISNPGKQLILGFDNSRGMLKQAAPLVGQAHDETG
jgi:hypothetical protein